MTRFRVVRFDSRDCGVPLCPEEAELGSDRCRRHQKDEPHREDRDAVNARIRDAERQERAAAAARAAEPAREPTKIAVGQFTETEITALYARYQDGESVRELAETVWEAKGYNGPGGCHNRIDHLFRKRGLPLRSRGEGRRLALERARGEAA